MEASRQVIVADPLDPSVADEPMVMGPVISAKAKQFILGMIETGVKEGATLALDGRGLVVPGREKGYFIGPTVFADVQPGMEIHKTEIFGPVVVILKAESFEEAVGSSTTTSTATGPRSTPRTATGRAASSLKSNAA